MTIFFTADNHFGHANIIKFCNRPYATVDEMNSDMVKKWNETVTRPDDEVWHLGDFSFGGAENFFHRLNGKKHLIIGNHDRRKILTLPWASQPVHYHEMKINDGEGIQRELILFHYPIEEWDNFYKGSIHLHGHVHGKKMQEVEKVRVDVAVDCHGFKPVTIDEILLASQK